MKELAFLPNISLLPLQRKDVPTVSKTNAAAKIRIIDAKAVAFVGKK